MTEVTEYIVFLYLLVFQISYMYVIYTDDMLMYCCIMQGILSFLCAPLVGALSDVWGRKPFLILTVSFTCAPLPLMRISPM